MFNTTSEISVELVGQYGNDERICFAAWVSTGTEMKAAPTEERKRGLIRSLMEQHHGSPFEAGYFEFRIHAPRAVRDEHVRHRIGFSYSSASSRYREIPPLFYIPPRDRPLKKGDNFKKMQPRYEPLSAAEYESYRDELENLYRSVAHCVQDIKDIGREETEAIRWGGLDGQMIPYIARCNPRSLMNFLELRTYESTANHPSYPMYEIEVVAREMEKALAEHYPITYEFFNEFGREAP